jgi:hypothetical protein
MGGFLPLNIGKKLLLWALLVWEALERKRVIEGKRLLKGKCQREKGTIAEGKMLKRG